MHRLPTVPKFTKSWKMFEYNLLFVRRLVDFVGLDFMIENYKFNWRTGSAVFFCVTVFGLSLYNTAFYYPDMYKICEVSIPLSICLQVRIGERYCFEQLLLFLFDSIECN